MWHDEVDKEEEEEVAVDGVCKCSFFVAAADSCVWTSWRMLLLESRKIECNTINLKLNRLTANKMSRSVRRRLPTQTLTSQRTELQPIYAPTQPCRPHHHVACSSRCFCPGDGMMQR